MEQALTNYLVKVSTIPRLTIEQEKTASVEELIKSGMGLVVALARKYTFGAEQFAEAIQDGNVGLLVAAGKLDTSKGSFSNIAFLYIRKSILVGKQRLGRIVRLSEKTSYKYNDAKKLAQEGLSREQICTALKIKPYVLDLLVNYHTATTSGTDDDFGNSYYTPEDESASIESQAETAEEFENVRKIVGDSALEIMVKRLQGWTEGDIAKEIGITRSGVQSRESRAVVKLNKARVKA